MAQVAHRANLAPTPAELVDDPVEPFDGLSGGCRSDPVPSPEHRVQDQAGDDHDRRGRARTRRPCPPAGRPTFIPTKLVTRVGTAMMAAQPVSFFMVWLSRTSLRARLVSKTEASVSRSPSTASATRSWCSSRIDPVPVGRPLAVGSALGEPAAGRAPGRPARCASARWPAAARTAPCAAGTPAAAAACPADARRTAGRTARRCPAPASRPRPRRSRSRRRSRTCSPASTPPRASTSPWLLSSRAGWKSGHGSTRQISARSVAMIESG